jgi:flavin-dependent dehydrogenase
VEDGRANLCLVVRRRAFEAAGRSWTTLFEALLAACPALAKRLAGGRPSTVKPLAIAAIPYGHVRTQGDGLWRLGDQAAVIPSFAGEGMSIAMHSARLAADAWLAGATSQTYQRSLARDVGPQVRRATWLSRALVRPWSQDIILSALRARPSLLPWAATTTRIPGRALVASRR